MVQVHKAELKHLLFPSAEKSAFRFEHRFQLNILIYHLQLAAVLVNVLHDGLGVLGTRHLPD